MGDIMIKYLKKIRKQVLLKLHIMEMIEKNNKFINLNKYLIKSIDLMKDHLNILEEEIRNLNPKSKFKDLDLESVSTTKSLRKWKIVNLHSFQKVKTESISVINTCYCDINNYLAFNETKNEVGEKIVIPSNIRNELKKIKINYNNLIDEIIGLEEQNY